MCVTKSGKFIAPGTYALLRFDPVPPSKPHRPFPGDHYHYAEANMRPDGKCFWNASLVTDTPLNEALPNPEEFV
jgi:hypothetical protein